MIKLDVNSEEDLVIISLPLLSQLRVAHKTDLSIQPSLTEKNASLSHCPVTLRERFNRQKQQNARQSPMLYSLYIKQHPLTTNNTCLENRYIFWDNNKQQLCIVLQCILNTKLVITSAQMK